MRRMFLSLGLVALMGAVEARAGSGPPCDQAAPAATAQSTQNGRVYSQQPGANAVAPQQQVRTVPSTTVRRTTRRYSYNPGPNFYPGGGSVNRPFGVNRSIRYAGSKIKADYAPYTGGSMQ